MTLGQHLVELRKRISIAALAIVVFSIPAWWAVDYVWAALSAPVLEVAERQNRDATLAYTTIGEAFDTRLLIMFLIGVVASSPIWLYQLWAFIVPALHQREKRFAIGFLAAAAALERVYAHLRQHGDSTAIGESYGFRRMTELMGFPEVWAFENRWAYVISHTE